MITSLFAITELSIFWYIFLPILFIYFTFEIESNDAPLRGSFVALFLLGAFQLFSEYKPLNYVWDYPLHSLILFIGYFIVGVVWVFIKWYSTVHMAIRDKKNGIWPIYKEFPLKVSDYKAKIYGWLIFWPFSATWTIFNDPIRHFANFVFHNISGTLQKISDNAYKDYQKDELQKK